MLKGARRQSQPEVVPELVGTENPKLGDGVSIGWQSSGARVFKSGVENVLVAGFDEPGTDREVLGESGRVVQSVEPIGEIAVGRLDRGLLVGDCRRFATYNNRRNSEISSSVFARKLGT